MYLLEKIGDAGYEGTYTTSIVCSEDKEKLDTLVITLKHNLSHIREHMTIFRNYLDTKFGSLRVQCRRTPEEMVELTLYENVLKSSYPDILKYDLFDTWFSVSDIEFEVKQIDSI